MSWKEDIRRDFQIFMGNGDEYSFKWNKAEKKTEFNVSTFDFPTVQGSLVRRNQPKGNTYDVEVYIDGDDHIDVARAFEISAKDSRHWHIRHPYYDDIRCQPVSIEYDNSILNVTKINISVIETILEPYTTTLDNPKDRIEPAFEALVNLAALKYDSNVDVGAKDIYNMNSTNEYFYKDIRSRITDNKISAKFINLYNKSKNAIKTANSNTSAAISALQRVVDFPFLLSGSVQERVGLLVSQSLRLRESILGVTQLSFVAQERAYYETVQVTVIGTMMTTSAGGLQPTDYQTAKEVVEMIKTITDVYNQFMIDLDNLQLQPVSGAVYIPDADNMTALSDLLNLTLGNLFNILSDSKIENSITLEKEYDIITLTHRLYGLDDNDDNMKALINLNEIGVLNLDYMNIPKGTSIKFLS